RISRCVWSTASRPPHKVSGISVPLAFNEASRREATSSLSSADMPLAGAPSRACWISPKVRCASSTIFIPSSKRRRARSRIDSSSASRAERLSAVILSFVPPAFLVQLLGGRGLGIAFRRIDDGDRRLALVDNARRRIAGDRAGAQGGAVAAGTLQQAGLGAAARRWAAEQGLDRLGLGAF